ncbi:MAG: hypothetical protein H7831_01125 [Magnetococcus sp. WYHC-3]
MGPSGMGGISPADWLRVVMGAAGLVGLFAGLWLLVMPGAAQWGGRSLLEPLREVGSHLRRPWRVERYVYRHHRWFGSLILGASLFVLSALIPSLVQYYDHPVMSRHDHDVLLQLWMWESLSVLFLLLCLLTLLAGVVILLRPSLLKPLERWANLPLSPEDVGKLVTGARHHLLRWVLHRPRVLGLLLFLSGGGLVWAWLLI